MERKISLVMWWVMLFSFYVTLQGAISIKDDKIPLEKSMENKYTSLEQSVLSKGLKPTKLTNKSVLSKGLKPTKLTNLVKPSAYGSDPDSGYGSSGGYNGGRGGGGGFGNGNGGGGGGFGGGCGECGGQNGGGFGGGGSGMGDGGHGFGAGGGGGGGGAYGGSGLGKKHFAPESMKDKIVSRKIHYL